jgi:membrane protein DedA with SNARE-associated domain
MTEILHILDKWMLNLAENYGYLGIFFGAFADVILPIIPSEIVLGLAGSYVAAGKLNFIFTLIASLAGNLSAASLLWYAGKKWGTGLIERFGKYLQFTHDDLVVAERKFNNGGYFFVFFSQFVPLMRSLIPIPSGILDLSYKKFIICIGLGATIWNTALITAGFYLRENFEIIDDVIKKFGYPLLFLVLCVLIYFVIMFYKGKSRNTKTI